MAQTVFSTFDAVFADKHGFSKICINIQCLFSRIGKRSRKIKRCCTFSVIWMCTCDRNDAIFNPSKLNISPQGTDDLPLLSIQPTPRINGDYIMHHEIQYLSLRQRTDHLLQQQSPQQLPPSEQPAHPSSGKSYRSCPCSLRWSYLQQMLPETGN